MKLNRLFYRVRQFWNALHTTLLDESELMPIQEVLSDQQMELFTRMQPSEQTHGLRVLQTLQNHGENHPDLLVAALLHDVGKINHPLHIWERVIIVFGVRLFPDRVKRWGSGQPKGWKRPFVVASEHPEWGADLAQMVGAGPLAVHLIRKHQDMVPPNAPNTLENNLLAILQGADNQN